MACIIVERAHVDIAVCVSYGALPLTLAGHESAFVNVTVDLGQLTVAFHLIVDPCALKHKPICGLERPGASALTICHLAFEHRAIGVGNFGRAGFNPVDPFAFIDVAGGVLHLADAVVPPVCDTAFIHDTAIV